MERASFGTWRVTVEYMSKQTRRLLSGNAEERTLCSALFEDSDHRLSKLVSCKELLVVLSATNTLRNDWHGHGGGVSATEAQLREARLLEEVHKLWEAFGNGWQNVQLIRALPCRPHNGMFDSEVALMVGSHSEFTKENMSMATYLDVERLYLMSPRAKAPRSLLHPYARPYHADKRR